MKPSRVPVELDGLCDLGHNAGLSGTCRRQDQERAGEMIENGYLLLVEIAHGIGEMRVSGRLETR